MRYSTIRKYFSNLSSTYAAPRTLKKVVEYPAKFSTLGLPAGFRIGSTSRTQRRALSSKTTSEKPPVPEDGNTPPKSPVGRGEKQQSSSHPSPDPLNHQDYSRFFRNLFRSVPHIHRPTRDDLLELTGNMWERFSIRFKWFTIKSFRKFNADGKPRTDNLLPERKLTVDFPT